MPIRQVTKIIQDWASLASFARDHGLLPRETWWLCRGVTDATYPLIPKIGRPHARIAELAYSPEDERALLDAFRAEARPYLPYTPASTIEWLAIAQHHGVPTRLLDWTESFLVAAFFAVRAGGRVLAIDPATGERTMRRVDAAIYLVLDPPRCGDTTHDHPFSVQYACAYVPPHISPQIPAQRSVFTLHANPTAEPELQVHKVLISSDACVEIKMVLDQQGINVGSIFPTIHGLSEQLEWRYKWGKLHAYRP